MESILPILNWLAIGGGGLLLIMLLLSLLGGLDLDFDVDIGGDTDVDTDAGFGVLKSFLTFISIGSWSIKVALISKVNLALAITVGIAAGLVAVFFLSWILRLLLRNQEEVNWHPEEAVGNSGTVYSRIPKGGKGIVKVEVRGAFREVKAKSDADKVIPSGAEVYISGCEDGVLVVNLFES
jgi:membrane protein implicated in regulation of membrane protease activity